MSRRARARALTGNYPAKRLRAAINRAKEREGGGRAKQRQPVEIDHERPILENEDGSFSTVESITVPDRSGNGWAVIPTIIRGQRFPEDLAETAYRNGVNEPLGEGFGSVDEADDFARRYSDESGRVREADRDRNKDRAGGGAKDRTGAGSAFRAGRGARSVTRRGYGPAGERVEPLIPALHNARTREVPIQLSTGREATISFRPGRLTETAEDVTKVGLRIGNWETPADITRAEMRELFDRAAVELQDEASRRSGQSFALEGFTPGHRRLFENRLADAGISTRTVGPYTVFSPSNAPVTVRAYRGDVRLPSPVKSALGGQNNWQPVVRRVRGHYWADNLDTANEYLGLARNNMPRAARSVLPVMRRANLRFRRPLRVTAENESVAINTLPESVRRHVDRREIIDGNIHTDYLAEAAWRAGYDGIIQRSTVGGENIYITRNLDQASDTIANSVRPTPARVAAATAAAIAGSDEAEARTPPRPGGVRPHTVETAAAGLPARSGRAIPEIVNEENLGSTIANAVRGGARAFAHGVRDNARRFASDPLHEAGPMISEATRGAVQPVVDWQQGEINAARRDGLGDYVRDIAVEATIGGTVRTVGRTVRGIQRRRGEEPNFRFPVVEDENYRFADWATDSFSDDPVATALDLGFAPMELDVLARGGARAGRGVNSFRRAASRPLTEAPPVALRRSATRRAAIRDAEQQSINEIRIELEDLMRRIDPNAPHRRAKNPNRPERPFRSHGTEQERRRFNELTHAEEIRRALNEGWSYGRMRELRDRVVNNYDDLFSVYGQRARQTDDVAGAAEYVRETGSDPNRPDLPRGDNSPARRRYGELGPIVDPNARGSMRWNLEEFDDAAMRAARYLGGGLAGLGVVGAGLESLNDPRRPGYDGSIASPSDEQEFPPMPLESGAPEPPREHRPVSEPFVNPRVSGNPNAENGLATRTPIDPAPGLSEREASERDIQDRLRVLGVETGAYGWGPRLERALGEFGFSRADYGTQEGRDEIMDVLARHVPDGWDRERIVREIQGGLAARGYPVGPTDGDPHTQTREGVEAAIGPLPYPGDSLRDLSRDELLAIHRGVFGRPSGRNRNPEGGRRR